VKLSKAIEVLAAHKAEFGDVEIKSWQWLERLLTKNGASLPDVTPGNNRVSFDLVKEMNRIESAADRGALVSFTQLRKHWPMTKELFDLMILDAAKKGVISLHRHDFTASLTEEQLAPLVRSDDAYYVGCALR